MTQAYNTSTLLTLFAISLVPLLCLGDSKKTAESHWQTGHSRTEGPSGDHAACYSAYTIMDDRSKTSTLPQDKNLCKVLE